MSQEYPIQKEILKLHKQGLSIDEISEKLDKEDADYLGEAIADLIKRKKLPQPSKKAFAQVAKRIAKREQYKNIIWKVICKVAAYWIDEAYPIRNTAWNRSSMTANEYVAEVSDLGNHLLDPWNRPITTARFRAIKDHEGEVSHWEGSTIVEGQRAYLMLFND